MYVVVNIDGGQGFMPKELKTRVQQTAFADNIIDRYGNSEYYDGEAIEYYEIQSLYFQLKHWLLAFPLYKING